MVEAPASSGRASMAAVSCSKAVRWCHSSCRVKHQGMHGVSHAWNRVVNASPSPVNEKWPLSSTTIKNVSALISPVSQCWCRCSTYPAQHSKGVHICSPAALVAAQHLRRREGCHITIIISCMSQQPMVCMTHMPRKLQQTVHLHSLVFLQSI
jgi:hypothetical protein